jgi:diguanylate cyclase (GGDEF)-like protein/PAS domain S-box-containing protein
MTTPLGTDSSVFLGSHDAWREAELPLRPSRRADPGVEGKLAARDRGSRSKKRGKGPVHPEMSCDHVPAALYTTDTELRIRHTNPAARELLGLGGLAAGVELRPLLLEARSTTVLALHERALEGHGGSCSRLEAGSMLLYRVEPIRNAAGVVEGCQAVVVETELPAFAEAALRRDKELAEVTLRSIGDGVIRTDRRGSINYLNPVAEHLTGWKAEAAVGRPLSHVFRLVDEQTHQPVDDLVKRCLEERRVIETRNHAQLVSADGKEVAVRSTAAPILGPDGDAVGAVLVLSDVTELRSMEREMAFLASHDPLTGLLNRRAFEGHLKRAVRSARAEGRRHAMLYLDLDEFKVVNDTCGHLVGDEMLKQVTALLRSRLGTSDILARLGGDEFGVLLESCPPERARQVAEEMRGCLSEFRFSWRGQLFDAGVSIGLVPMTADSGDFVQVMSGADTACYIAKERGRNRVHEYEADDTAVSERYGEMQWVNRIRAAFEEKRFRLFHQMIHPLNESAEGETLCEVFVRMLDRTGNVIAPAAFIAAAERYHIAIAIDRWVVETALGAVAEAQRQPGGNSILFAINLSGQSLTEASFLTFIGDEIDRLGVDPHRVAFEITETAAISKLDRAIDFITTLKRRGVRFILDDFGTGLSSFAYLRDLPVDFLKIDGEFVRGMTDDRIKRALVESINQIGHVMGIRTIAEWVENDETLGLIRALGIDYAQGFWLCRPQPMVHDL